MPKQTTIVVDTEKLGEALTSLSKVIQVPTNTATYRCVMVVIKGKKMTLRGTDLMMYVERILPVKAVKGGDGSWLVVFDTFFHYIRTSPGLVTITLTDTDVHLKTKTDKAAVKTRDTKDYVDWPKWSEMEEIDCDGTVLVDTISRATASAAETLIKPILNSVSIKGVNVQSANGFRFQVKKYLNKKSSKTDVLIPYTSCLKVGGISRPIDSVVVNDRMLGFRSEGETTYLTLKEGAGEYPDFTAHALPKPLYTAVIQLTDLLPALEKIKGFVDKEYRLLALSMKNGLMQLSVDAGDRGKYNGSFRVKAGKGRPVEVNVDLDDVLSFLDQVNDKTSSVIIRIAGDTQPYQLVDPRQKDFLYVGYPLVVEKTT